MFDKKVIKSICCALSICVLASFSGCSKTSSSGTKAADVNSTGLPIVNKKITLKVMGAKSPIQGNWSDLYVFNEMEKRTNIHLEFDTPPSQNYPEKKNLMFASGQYPDMFFGGMLSAQDEIIYGEQGILIPIDGYIDTYCPNLKSLFDKNPNIKKSITTMNKHIYSLPYVGDVSWELTPKLWVNKVWMDNLNKSMPTNVDQLYDLLQAFKTGDPNKNGKPDEVPLTFDNMSLSAFRPSILSYFGIIATSLKVDVKDDHIRYYPSSNEYKGYLQFMSKLHSNKLLDEEAFIQTNQQVTAKGNENRLGVFSNAAAMLSVGANLQNDYVALPPLTSNENSNKVWTKSSSIARGAFAITNTNKYPEATMRWVDTFYSEEGGIFIMDGQEGLSWKWTDDSKTKWERIMPQGEFKSTEEFRGGKISPAAGTIIPGYMTTGWRSKLNAPHVPILVKEINEKYTPYWVDEYPQTYFTQEEQKNLSALETDLTKYVEQMEASFITGVTPIGDWDHYIEVLNKMGCEKVRDLYQTAYDRWKQ